MDNILDTKSTVGRPFKFTPETRDKIYTLITIPIPFGTIANAAGITLRTFEKWLKRGRELKQSLLDNEITEDDLADIDKEFLEFYSQCLKLEADLESRIVQDVYENETGGKKFILSKRFSSWQEKTQVEHSGKVDVALSWKELVSGEDE